MSKRYAGFGYGKKSIFNKKDTNPGPGTYPQKSDFTQRPSRNAYTFGLSYEKYLKVYLENDRKADKNNPGPGTYTLPSKIGSEGLKYTLKPKIQNNMLKYISSIPGPGHYATPQATSKNGSYFNSKFKNSRAGIISPSRSVRFPDYGKQSYKSIPGPGTYNPESTISPDGKYSMSRLKGSMCRTFYHYNRDTMPNIKKKKDTPATLHNYPLSV